MGPKGSTTPWNGLHSKIDFLVEATNIEVELSPLSFTYSTSIKLHDSGRLLVKVSGLSIWADATLEFTNRRASAVLQKVEVQIKKLELQTEASAAFLYDMVLSIMGEQIKEAVEEGVQDVLESQLVE